VEYFNKYAYIEIALYGTRSLQLHTDLSDGRRYVPRYVGKPYIAAAKDTWHLLTDRGVDAIINDTIVGFGEY
jgi:hypothetical protein